MPRTRTDPSLRKSMCDRLKRLLRTAYDENWSQLSDRLGYADKSAIQAVLAGRSFLDVQRLEKLSSWTTDGGFVPSLHWILSGQGPELLLFEGDTLVDTLELTELAKRRAKSRKI